MNRRDLALMVLAAADGQSFTPVQIQKAIFLVSTNLPGVVTEGQKFNFQAYDYGPFDRAVYDEIATLRDEELAGIGLDASRRWDFYFATARGTARGEELLATLQEKQSTYIRDVVQWVRKQTFASLVKSIYDAYPEMKANSIFNY